MAGLDIGECGPGLVYGQPANSDVLGNRMAQDLSDTWHRMGEEIPPQAKEKIAIWYVCIVLRVVREEQVSLENLEPIRNVLGEVSKKMVAVHTRSGFRTCDIADFWKRVFSRFPIYHSSEQTTYILSRYGEKSIRWLLRHLNSSEAPLLHRLNGMLQRIAPLDHPS